MSNRYILFCRDHEDKQHVIMPVKKEFPYEEIVDYKDLQEYLRSRDLSAMQFKTIHVCKLVETLVPNLQEITLGAGALSYSRITI